MSEAGRVDGRIRDRANGTRANMLMVHGFVQFIRRLKFLSRVRGDSVTVNWA